MEENKCTNCVDEKLKTEIGEILKKYKGHKDNLIPILNEVQVKYGYKTIYTYGSSFFRCNVLQCF